MELTVIDNLLSVYTAALEQVASNKAYSINGRSVTKQDIPAILQVITYLEGKRAEAVAAEEQLPHYVQTVFAGRW